MQKKKYSKPVLEVEYYTLETTIAACGETTTSLITYGDTGSAASEGDLGFSAYSFCGDYYSAGAAASVGESLS